MTGPIYPAADFNVNATPEELKTDTVKGEIVSDHDALPCVRLKLVPKASFTLKQADRVSDGSTHLAIARFRSDLTGTCRFVLPSGRVLEINGQPRRDDEARPRYLEFDLIERERPR